MGKTRSATEHSGDGDARGNLYRERSSRWFGWHHCIGTGCDGGVETILSG